MNRTLLILLFCSVTRLTGAQSKLSGVVLEYRADIALSGIRIENLNTHDTAQSDPLGKFTISAKKGDLILFSGLNYKPDTLYLVDLKYKTVFLLLKQYQLKEVKITDGEVNKNAISPYHIITPFGGKVVRYQTDAAGNPTGGVKFNVFDSHKDERKRAQARGLEIGGQKQQEIAKTFNATNLQAYLPIRGQEMENFVILYMPDAATWYSSKFNLMLYINDCYKKFLQIPAEKRQSKTFMQLTNSN